MKSYEQLAQAAHAAYCKKVLESAQAGPDATAPAWVDLNAAARECWIAAVKHLWAEFSVMH